LGVGEDSTASAGRPQSGVLLTPGLYVVATPIGNARDITLRALDVLAAADVVLAEDTRVAAKLFAIHGIRARLSTYNEHNAERERPRVLARLRAGARVALISDAGTPLVSDPGFKLVREALKESTRVYAVPGASAVLAGLVVSGLPSDRFLFAGFLPTKTRERRRALEKLKDAQTTLIFFESTRRLAETLRDMSEILGSRTGAVMRELTKLHEETQRGELADLARRFASGAVVKGEATIVVHGVEKLQKGVAQERDEEDRIDQLLRHALVWMPLREAVDLVSAASEAKRKIVYARALKLKSGGPR